MNSRKFLGGILLTGSLLLILGGILLVNAWLSAPLPVERPQTIKIDRGMTGTEIARLLRDEGVITSPTGFRWALWIKRAERDLRGGTIRLTPPLSLNGLIDQLRRKRPFLKKVQLHEGWPSWRIFRVLSRELNLRKKRFKNLAEDPDFIRRLGLDVRNLEGYLFPDTYYVSADAGPEQVLRQIVSRFLEVEKGNRLRRRARQRGLSLREAVTLASIIEREARVDRERPLISAVYHNRLDQGIPLQADPTLLYPVGNFQAPITHTMLRSDNPYNTYQRRGLPPSPISNPGERSLLASVQPAEVPYLYFVSRGDGTHVFSETLDQHQKAVRKYQKR